MANNKNAAKVTFKHILREHNNTTDHYANMVITRLEGEIRETKSSTITQSLSSIQSMIMTNNTFLKKNQKTNKKKIQRTIANQYTDTSIAQNSWKSHDLFQKNPERIKF